MGGNWINMGGRWVQSSNMTHGDSEPGTDEPPRSFLRLAMGTGLRMWWLFVFGWWPWHLVFIGFFTGGSILHRTVCVTVGIGILVAFSAINTWIIQEES